ncbi:MAG: mannose-1-phosphate guanylyltransferase/mannose-6-phosphate isomerase, partial [Gammaproteobacteria bacterium]
MPDLQPVILSGGSGTRLWPLSREKYPKQLLALSGVCTMLQATAQRVSDYRVEGMEVRAPIVVCNEEYRFVTAEQLRAVGCAKPRVVLEPFGRNTAPALTLAAHAALIDADDAILLVMPADHVVHDTEAFHASVAAGIPAALDGALVTFGIVPDRPETGYGYIQTGESRSSAGRASSASTDVLELRRFVEKPDEETAAAYVQSGTYLWNSGIFMMRASVWLAAIERFEPQIAQACKQAVAGARKDIDFLRVDADAFRVSPSNSIDYAVMERLSEPAAEGLRACVVPMEAGWSDVGAWDAVWQVSDRDENGNSTQGDVALESSRDTLAISTSRLMACLGLDNMVVVETPDAVLVADKRHTQQIKTLVSRLKEQGHPCTVNHRKVHRPWGYYDSIDAGDRFQVKRIVVKPGAAISLQLHHHRAEHWIIVSGQAEVTNGDQVTTLVENQ